MLNNRKIDFLIKEITKLKDQNLIEENTAGKIIEYYTTKKSPKNIMALIIVSISIFATLSIISGIILVVVTFNWHIFTKEVKTVLAFMMLIVPQVLCLLQLLKKDTNQKNKEIFSLILSIFFGVTMAFVGQIYRLPENSEFFLFLWLISTIVIVYLFDSLTSSVLYMFLLIFHTSIMQIDGKIGLYFYPLFSLIIPFYIMEFRKKQRLRVKFLDYLFIITMVIALGITLEKVIPGLWIIAYSNLFVILYLLGVIFEKDNKESIFYSPYKISGILGIAILAYIYSFSWPWDEIGWDYYRIGEKFNKFASIFDYIVVIALPVISIYLLYISIIKKRLINYILSSFGILIVVLYILTSAFLKNTNNFILIIPVWSLNIFVVLYCIYFFYIGYKNKSLLTVNLSTFMVCGLIVTRFFDFDMPILARGFAFIVLGVFLVLLNLILSKKFKKIIKRTTK